MRYIILLAALFLFSLSAPAYAAPSVHNGNGCVTLGATQMDIDHGSIVACVLNTPSTSVTSCNAASPYSCTWKSMTADASAASVPAGTLCGDYGSGWDFNATYTTRTILCQGKSPATGCPTGYSPSWVGTANQGHTYCVKQ